MRTITARKELLKKLQKNNLLFDGVIFYLSDFHKTKVGNSIAHKVIGERLLEPTIGTCHFFEKEWRLRKEVGEHLGVQIFKDDQRNQFFFTVKKGVYDIDTYSLCIDKLDYLNTIGETLNKKTKPSKISNSKP